MKSSKNKTVVLVLCIFLSYFGIHRFYVGKKGTGFLWLFTVGLCGFGWILDIILILLNKFTDGQGNVISSEVAAPAPIKGASAPIKGASAPIKGASAPIKGASAPIKGASAPIKGASAPIKGASAPIKGASAPMPLRGFFLL